MDHTKTAVPRGKAKLKDNENVARPGPGLRDGHQGRGCVQARAGEQPARPPVGGDCADPVPELHRPRRAGPAPPRAAAPLAQQPLMASAPGNGGVTATARARVVTANERRPAEQCAKAVLVYECEGQTCVGLLRPPTLVLATADGSTLLTMHVLVPYANATKELQQRKGGAGRSRPNSRWRTRRRGSRRPRAGGRRCTTPCRWRTWCSAA